MNISMTINVNTEGLLGLENVTTNGWPLIHYCYFPTQKTCYFTATPTMSGDTKHDLAYRFVFNQKMCDSLCGFHKIKKKYKCMIPSFCAHHMFKMCVIVHYMYNIYIIIMNLIYVNFGL